MTGLWTLHRVAKAVGAKSSDDRAVRGISTDTRTVCAGDVFVALRGERFDGHAFLGDAVGKGAVAVVVDDGAPAAGLGVPTFVVPDTLRALGALGAYARTAWARPVIAVGGSNGKTTTKELVRAALGSTLAVHATAGNLNNRIGVPQTLLALPEAADIAVVEVGTNQPGEIAILRDIARPDIALITTVQEEHLEGFGDLAGVMAEEMSLCDGVALAVVPAAEPAVVARARASAERIVTAGVSMGDVRADAWGLGAEGRAWLRLGDITVNVPAPGAHNAANAMLAMAVARACGVSDADAGRGIEAATFPPMRSAVSALGDAVLINDAYNSNPGSVRAALALLEAVGAGRPTVAILGTMRELGAQSDALHDDVARATLASDVDLIGAIGEFAAAFERVAPGSTRVVGAADPELLWPRIESRIDRRAAILLKASRGVRLERLVPRLAVWAGVPLTGTGSH